MLAATVVVRRVAPTEYKVANDEGSFSDRGATPAGYVGSLTALWLGHDLQELAKNVNECRLLDTLCQVRPGIVSE